MKPKKVTVLKLKDILRLHYQAQLSTRQIARSLNVSSSVVSKHLIRARGAQLHWPLPEGVGEAQLRDILQPKRNGSSTALLAKPDFCRDVGGTISQRYDSPVVVGGVCSSAPG